MHILQTTDRSLYSRNIFLFLRQYTTTPDTDLLTMESNHNNFYKCKIKAKLSYNIDQLKLLLISMQATKIFKNLIVTTLNESQLKYVKIPSRGQWLKGDNSTTIMNITWKIRSKKASNKFNCLFFKFLAENFLKVN